MRLDHIADAVAKRGDRHVADVAPVDADRPLVGLDSRLIDLSKVVLPDPDGPDQGDELRPPRPPG